MKLLSPETDSGDIHSNALHGTAEMLTLPSFETWSTAQKLAYAYLGAGLLGLVVLALREPSLEPWFWRSVMFLLPLVVSLRGAIVYAYRKHPSRLSWWLRASHGEPDMMGFPGFYAVLFGAFALAVVLFV